eukprot:1162078-Pelagomonas_calceolata.AAC.1
MNEKQKATLTKNGHVPFNHPTKPRISHPDGSLTSFHSFGLSSCGAMALCYMFLIPICPCRPQHGAPCWITQIQLSNCMLEIDTSVHIEASSVPDCPRSGLLPQLDQELICFINMPGSSQFHLQTREIVDINGLARNRQT